jgi:hypothetical protein
MRNAFNPLLDTAQTKRQGNFENVQAFLWKYTLNN